MFCKKCGKPINDNDEKCSNCGAENSTKYVPKYSTEIYYCKVCGKEAGKEDNFCRRCGEALSFSDIIVNSVSRRDKKPISEDKQRWMYIPVYTQTRKDNPPAPAETEKPSVSPEESAVPAPIAEEKVPAMEEAPAEKNPVFSNDEPIKEEPIKSEQTEEDEKENADEIDIVVTPDEIPRSDYAGFTAPPSPTESKEFFDDEAADKPSIKSAEENMRQEENVTPPSPTPAEEAAPYISEDEKQPIYSPQYRQGVQVTIHEAEQTENDIPAPPLNEEESEEAGIAEEENEAEEIPAEEAEEITIAEEDSANPDISLTAPVENADYVPLKSAEEGEKSAAKKEEKKSESEEIINYSTGDKAAERLHNAKKENATISVTKPKKVPENKALGVIAIVLAIIFPPLGIILGVITVARGWSVANKAYVRLGTAAIAVGVIMTIAISVLAWKVIIPAVEDYILSKKI